MMSRQKHFGYRATFPDGRFRILGMFQKPMGKGFLFRGRLIPKHAGYKPDGRVNQGLCGDLATRQDKVAQ